MNRSQKNKQDDPVKSKLRLVFCFLQVILFVLLTSSKYVEVVDSLNVAMIQNTCKQLFIF